MPHLLCEMRPLMEMVCKALPLSPHAWIWGPLVTPLYMRYFDDLEQWTDVPTIRLPPNDFRTASCVLRETTITN